MEIQIKIAMVDINVIMNNHDLSEREMKIIEVLFLNLAAQVNAQITKDGMAFNPLDKNGKDDIFHFQFAWQSSLSPDKYEEIKAGINRRFTNTIKMCNLPEINITFKENAYLTR
ncbi:hypothetical protein ACQKP0_14265 [Heyndrickxia sp. NPDC080065]|uniref:hypothetical protein n=1 Tax=Heyndrickxia sp. NPDC080065 TaxID=3390568 RepID=UPI003D07EDE3